MAKSIVTVCALAAVSVTVKVALTVPLLPSVTVTSLMITSGLHSPTSAALLRGFGCATKKSLALSFVSTQPPALRKTAVVLLPLVKGAGPLPS